MIVGVERYLGVLKDSLFSFLHEEDIKAILPSAEVLIAEKGHRIMREEAPQGLYLLLEGEASLRIKSGADVGRIIPGRSFELKPLILKEQNWQFDWVAETNTTYMRIAWPVFEGALKKNMQAYQYLGRISGSVALQRLKRDLVGLGLTRDAIVEIISNLHQETVDSIFSDWSRKVFFTLQQGEVMASVRFNDHKCKVAYLQAGDTSLVNLRETKLTYEADENTRAWVLFENEWGKLKHRDQFDRFLEVFSLHKENLVEPEQVETTRVVDIEKIAPAKRAGEPTDYLNHSAASRFAMMRRRLMKPEIVGGRDENRSTLSVLATLANFFRRPMGQRRIETKIQGLASSPSFEGLAKAARILGFQTKFIESENLPLNSKYWPAIVLLDSGFRILFSSNGITAIMGDPDTGTVFEAQVDRLQERMLEQRVLLIADGAALKSRRDPEIPIESYIQILFSRPYLIFLFVVAGVLGFFFDLSLPVLNQYLFDVVISTRNSRLFYQVIGVILLFSVFSTYLQNFSQRVSSDLLVNFNVKMKSFFMNRVFQLPVDYVRNMGTSGVLTRFTDLDSVGQFFSQGLLNSFLGVFLMVGSLSVLWLYHHWLVYTIVSLIPLEVIIVRWLKPRLEKARFEASQLKAGENRMIMEHFTSTDDMRALKGQLTSRWRWQLSAQQGARNLRKSGVYNAIFQICHFLMGEIVKIICFLVAVKLYLDGQLTLGQVVGTSLLVPKVSSPLQNFVSTYFQYFSVRPTLVMVNDLIYGPVEPVDMGEPHEQELPLRGNIEFRDVSFAYDPTQEPTLRNISFRIKAGEKIAIIGPSGSGKSSIANLLTGLYEASGGHILIDDTAIELFDLSSLRKAIGFVEQDGVLFAGSIQENIAWGDPEPEVERVQRAAAMAEIEEEILAKPGGYAFPIQHGGVGVSEGQKQRMLIARAIYQNPSIMILDEATSHLDPISEERVISRMMDKFKDKTVLFFTHRVHLTMKADRVLYVEDGKLMEIGTHNELIANRSKYYEFFLLHLSLG